MSGGLDSRLEIATTPQRFHLHIRGLRGDLDAKRHVAVLDVGGVVSRRHQAGCRGPCLRLHIWGFRGDLDADRHRDRAALGFSGVIGGWHETGRCGLRLGQQQRLRLHFRGLRRELDATGGQRGAVLDLRGVFG